MPRTKWNKPARHLDGKTRKEYDQWASMRKRCKATGNNATNYTSCSYTPEWDSWDIWMSWAEKQVGFLSSDDKGWIYELDKDILGSNLYNPETCVFVPDEINTFFCSSRRSRGTLPIGVHYHTRNHNYVAQCTSQRGKDYIGCYPTPELAFAAYAEVKENAAKALALKYAGLVDQRVIEALNNYAVNIND